MKKSISLKIFFVVCMCGICFSGQAIASEVDEQAIASMMVNNKILNS